MQFLLITCKNYYDYAQVKTLMQLKQAVQAEMRKTLSICFTVSQKQLMISVKSQNLISLQQNKNNAWVDDNYKIMHLHASL